ncbi:MAG: hypothetical protein R3279_06510 [Putridiphycobacter sp.]|nr:hypothetical protein [Putridiphycobacter sp.]
MKDLENMPNSEAIANASEKAVQGAATYQEALAQVENMIWAAYGDGHDALSKQVTDELWLKHHV